MDDSAETTSVGEISVIEEGIEFKHIERRVVWRSCVGMRHVICFMGFLGFVNVYCLRVNLSVALVAMGEFNWDENTQGLVLGSFFYGYILTQIPGGWLSAVVGGKCLFGLGIFVTSVLTVLTPLVARTSVGLLIALRVLEGMAEGVTFPAAHALLGKWAPPLERSKLGTFVYSGTYLGAALSLILSGYLCQSSLGWPSVFYVFGMVGCFWFLIWILVARNSPASHPWISEGERLYIERSIGHADDIKRSVPWLAILKSTPVWAVVIAHFCNNWGFYTLLTCLPTYMKNILNFHIENTGRLSAIPYAAIWVAVLISGQIADWLRYNHILSTTVVRKIFTCAGQIMPAAFMLGLGYVGCDKVLAVALVSLAVGLNGLTQAGFNVNHLDIAPVYAGTLMGCTNAIATIPGFVGPQLVGALTYKNNTAAAWQIVFYISAGVYVAGAVLYGLMASGHEQSWSTDDGYTLQNNEEDNADAQIQQQ